MYTLEEIKAKAEKAYPDLHERRKQWLDSHLQVYINDPSKRAVDENNDCMYLDEHGRTCIIGQDMQIDFRKSLQLLGTNAYEDRVITLLPMETVALGTGFLQSCQILHDDPDYWDEQGFTQAGKEAYQAVIEKYCKSPQH